MTPRCERLRIDRIDPLAGAEIRFRVLWVAMDSGQVYVRILELPTQEKLIVSAFGIDRDQAENKVITYFKSLEVRRIRPELVAQWLKMVAPMTPEVTNGVWILGANVGRKPVQSYF